MFGFFFIRRGDSTIIRACAKVVAVAHNSGGGWEYKLCDILKSAEVKNSMKENLDIMLEL